MDAALSISNALPGAANVLVVEDNFTIRKALVEWLVAVFPAFHFIEAESGEEALRQMDESRPALVLMDITLPRMNGIEATRQIKARAAATRVVMLTVHEDQEYQVDSLRAGADGFVSKSHIFKDLLPVVRKLLEA
jgi:DNA-binding NarL/FixJ family response regulator